MSTATLNTLRKLSSEIKIEPTRYRVARIRSSEGFRLQYQFPGMESLVDTWGTVVRGNGDLKTYPTPKDVIDDIISIDQTNVGENDENPRGVPIVWLMLNTRVD